MKPFRMIHFSDLHEALPMRDVSGFLDKRIVGAVNSLLNRRKVHRRERIVPALERMLKENPDLIVFTGDAVTCGQPSEFELALKDLKVLTDSGIPLIFSPGNHDAYVRNRKCHAAYEEFVRRVTGGLLSLESFPKALDFGPLRFLVFNAARPTNPVLSCGFLDRASQELIGRECAEREKPLVGVCHFPFRRIRKGLVNGLRHQLFGAKEAADLLSAGKLDLLLCGHVHTPFFDLDSSGRGETSCGSLTRFGAYSVIEYRDGKFFHSRSSVSPAE